MLVVVEKKEDNIIVYRHAIWKNYANENADLKTGERGWTRPGQKAEQDTTPNLDGAWTLFVQHFILTWHGRRHDSCTNKTENKDRTRFFP
jgi:hypothetical protein